MDIDVDVDLLYCVEDSHRSYDEYSATTLLSRSLWKLFAIVFDWRLEIFKFFLHLNWASYEPVRARIYFLFYENDSKLLHHNLVSVERTLLFKEF